jgi:PAS domain S-box-containing protein
MSIDDGTRVVQALLDEAERVAAIGSYTWDLRTNAVVWSDNCYRLLDLEPGSTEPSIERFMGAIHPDDAAGVQANLQAAMVSETAPPMRFRLVADDVVRHMLSRALPVRDADGELLRMVGTIQDVTHEREREATMALQSEMLEQAQAAAHIGSWVWHPTSGVITWSPELYRIMGVSPDRPPSVESFDRQVHPDDLPGLRASRAETLQTGIPRPSELRIVRPSGEVRYVSIHAASVETPELRLFGIVHDVTERRQLEEQARRAQAVEAVGRLAAGIAHDFNNLLTVIIGSLLIAQEDQPESRDLADALRAASASAELTQRLLSLGRATQSPLLPLQLDDAVKGCDGILRGALTDAIQLEIDADSGVVVDADRRQLDQALLNLALNAREAMGGGPGRLVIRTRRAEGGAVVEVIDNGTGMTDEVRARALEPFFTTRRTERGSGLGLTMVHGAVMVMGGTLELLPGPGGVGTCVQLWLPVSRSSGIPQEPPSPRRNLAGIRLLVVEDDPAVRRLTCRLLARAGMEVHDADGPPAAAAFQGELDLVLCDVVMPHGGGRAVAEEFARTRPDTRLLFMTGYADRADWLEHHPVIQKPFMREELLEAVSVILADGTA